MRETKDQKAIFFGASPYGVMQIFYIFSTANGGSKWQI